MLRKLIDHLFAGWQSPFLLSPSSPRLGPCGRDICTSWLYDMYPQAHVNVAKHPVRLGCNCGILRPNSDIDQSLGEVRRPIPVRDHGAMDDDDGV